MSEVKDKTELTNEITSKFRELDPAVKQIIHSWVSREYDMKLTSLMYSDDVERMQAFSDKLNEAIESDNWEFFMEEGADKSVAKGQAAPVKEPVKPKPEPKAEPKPEPEEEYATPKVAPATPKVAPKAQVTSEDPFFQMMADRLQAILMPTLFAQVEAMQPKQDDDYIATLITESNYQQAMRYLKTFEPKVARKVCEKFLKETEVSDAE